MPDAFFDQADEVVMVDVSADDLLARLAAGKVYVPEQIERAATNFFRKGNLMALRELALRRTADRVEDDVRTYRTTSRSSACGRPRIRCCAASGPTPATKTSCAARPGLPASSAWNGPPSTSRRRRCSACRMRERERILLAVKLAQEFGATTAILAGSDPAAQVVEYAREHNCSKVLVGRAFAAPWRPGIRTSRSGSASWRRTST